MKLFAGLSQEDVTLRVAQAQKAYDAFCKQHLNLNMSRGVPGVDQLDLSDALLSVVSSRQDCLGAGAEVRNYGLPDGLPAAKALMAEVLGVSPEQVLLGGNASLQLMYGTISRAMTHGMTQGAVPWCRQEKITFLCPVPGYDRHFSICEHFGIAMIPIAMTPDGPDMAQIEEHIKDPGVKGLWCVPKYSNPQGIVYSPETVHKLAALKPAADDFRIFWDNAYAVHDLYEEQALASIAAACKQAGNPELAIQFASTSKVTFPGGGISVMAAGPETLAWAKQSLFFETIGPDKINEWRHVKLFSNLDGIRAHMRLHAEKLRPKFELVARILESELVPLGLASFTPPRGGYFVSVDVPNGCARRTVELMKAAGVIVTPAGSTWPYKQDPHDANLRIAPTFPPLSELQTAMELFAVCVVLAAAEKASV